MKAGRARSTTRLVILATECPIRAFGRRLRADLLGRWRAPKRRITVVYMGLQFNSR
jgi:hypothetical protein